MSDNEKEISDNFADNLLIWYEKKHLQHGDQKKIAKFLGKSPSALSNIFKKRRGSNEGWRRFVADKIGLPYEQMIADPTREPSKEKTDTTHENLIPLDDHRKPEDLPHEEIIAQFVNKEWARRVNALLLKIEKDPGQRRTVETILKSIADQLIAEKNAGSDS